MTTSIGATVDSDTILYCKSQHRSQWLYDWSSRCIYGCDWLYSFNLLPSLGGDQQCGTTVARKWTFGASFSPLIGGTCNRYRGTRKQLRELFLVVLRPPSTVLGYHEWHYIRNQRFVSNFERIVTGRYIILRNKLYKISINFSVYQHYILTCRYPLNFETYLSLRNKCHS